MRLSNIILIYEKTKSQKKIKKKASSKRSDANTEEGLKKRQRSDVNTEEDLKKETHV